eukprot:jgi/Chlat1/3070/Chrsp21S03316
MEELRAALGRVRIPVASNKVFKEECCLSFDTPKSDGGLFIDLNSFLAFGKDYVMYNFNKTGNPVYFNITRTRKPIEATNDEDPPRKRPTLLAIGVDGGFEAGPKDEFEDTYKIVVLPNFVELPYPSVELPEKVRLSVDGILSATGAEKRAAEAAWIAEKRQVSKFARDLQQLSSGVVVPARGWKCQVCGIEQNLWLNLTDGAILCGRRNWDGTGGNNHAVEHYQRTKYPLAVKLGTITADLQSADVYSYAEDDAVEDPNLDQHLAHFGIDFSSLTKTEQTTAELELDQNLSFDFSRIQESGKTLQPVFGPGYTGLVNLGNSCYMASVVQAAFSIKEFQDRYCRSASLSDAYQTSPADPTVDIYMQLVKLAHGLLDGKYSKPPEPSGREAPEDTAARGQEGIAPRMFKSVVGAGHPEFSSSRQQDALEFFQHLLELLHRNNHGRGVSDGPETLFSLKFEDRVQCQASGKVRYTTRADNTFSVSIPLEAAVNKEEMALYEIKKKAADEVGQKLAPEELVRPRVPLSACLEASAAPELVEDFYSTAVKGKTTAVKTTRLATFPDYLMLHLRKFRLDKGWVPTKLDVFVDVPDEIDLSPLRGRGLQPGEELLPEETEPSARDAGPQADESIVSQLMDMGFPQLRAQKAAISTGNAGAEEAMNWLLAHMEDADIDEPLQTSGGNSAADVTVDEEGVSTLCAMGFERRHAVKALQATGNNLERAADWIFSHASDLDAMDVDANGAALPQADDAGIVRDGAGKYRLMGFISHMGSSTHAGHYVYHALRDGRWVLFNDNKVAVSEDPPKDLGYLYLFQRIAS